MPRVKSIPKKMPLTPEIAAQREKEAAWAALRASFLNAYDATNPEHRRLQEIQETVTRLWAAAAAAGSAETATTLVPQIHALAKQAEPCFFAEVYATSFLKDAAEFCKIAGETPAAKDREFWKQKTADYLTAFRKGMFSSSLSDTDNRISIE
jgi:hypothetical protein